jgi:hypothetical protein
MIAKNRLELKIVFLRYWEKILRLLCKVNQRLCEKIRPTGTMVLLTTIMRKNDDYTKQGTFSYSQKLYNSIYYNGDYFA